MVHRFAHLCEALDRSAHGVDSAAAALGGDGTRAATGAQESAPSDGARPAPLPELLRYFEAASPHDAAWAVYLLAGGRLKPAFSNAQAHAAGLQLSGFPPWLFEECLRAASDLAECLALVLPPPAALSQHGLAYWVEQRLQPLRGVPPQPQTAALAQACNELDPAGRQTTLKLLTGAWRSPVSPLQVQHALARTAGLSTHAVARRLQGYTAPQKRPNAVAYAALVAAADGATRHAEPYPFAAAHPLPQAWAPASLGAIERWLLQWHWGGLPAQVVRRGGACFIWSAQGELLTARLPELEAACVALPEGTVLTGELLAWPDSADADADADAGAGAGADAEAMPPLPVQRLQQRLQRKTLTPQQRREVPAVFLVHDVLEWQGRDLRMQPLHQRQWQLAQCLPDQRPPSALRRAMPLQPASWAAAALQCQAARTRGAQGLLLRSLDAVEDFSRLGHQPATGPVAQAHVGPIGPGQRAGEPTAWIWKASTLSVTTVLLYAQAGSGASGNAAGGATGGVAAGATTGAFRDYSFGVWNRAPRDEAEVQGVLAAVAAKQPLPTDPTALRLVPLAKANAGLSAPDWAIVHETVRTQALEKFGPVRSLKPSLVVQLAFDHITPSRRHKSGLVLGGVRMVRLAGGTPLLHLHDLGHLRALLVSAPES